MRLGFVIKFGRYGWNLPISHYKTDVIKKKKKPVRISLGNEQFDVGGTKMQSIKMN